MSEPVKRPVIESSLLADLDCAAARATEAAEDLYRLFAQHNQPPERINWALPVLIDARRLEASIALLKERMGR